MSFAPLRRLAIVVLACALLAAACGSADVTPSAADQAAPEPTAAPVGASDDAAPAGTDGGGGDNGDVQAEDDDSAQAEQAGDEPDQTFEDAGPEVDTNEEDGGSALGESTSDGPNEDGDSNDGDSDGDSTLVADPPVSTVTGSPGSVGIGDSYYPLLGNGGYDVSLYNLILTWEPSNEFLSGTAIISATATQDLSAFNLDLYGMDVSGISVNGQDATFRRDEAELTVELPTAVANGVEFQVEVAYGGSPEAVPALSNIDADGWITNGDVSYVAGEPGGASGWFPVNDHPLDKARFRFEITAPAEANVATNGLLVSKQDNGATSTWVYETAFPQAPYLTTVVIGSVELFTTGEVDGVVIRHALDSDLAEQILPQVESTANMVSVLSDIFGPYPFEAYGIAMVNSNLNFALETQTLSIFGTDFLGGGDFQSVLAHELAHQWFGDSISVADWSDIWLNEGFATYSQYLYEEALDPNYDINLEMERFTRFGPTAVEFPPPGNPGSHRLFASTVYLRGALTLHALRLTIGDDAFFTTLRTYVERHTGGNVSTADFIAVAEEVSGQQLDDLFDAWLYQDALPELP